MCPTDAIRRYFELSQKEAKLRCWVLRSNILETNSQSPDSPPIRATKYVISTSNIYSEHWDDRVKGRLAAMQAG